MKIRDLEEKLEKTERKLESVSTRMDGLEVLSTGNRNNNRETEIERRERSNEIKSSQGQQVNNLKKFLRELLSFLKNIFEKIFLNSPIFKDVFK